MKIQIYVMCILVLLFREIYAKDFSGRSFRPILINTTESNDMYQLLKVANPSGSNTEVTFDDGFSTILEEGNGIELNITEHAVQSVTANQSIFVIVETYQASKLIDALPIIPNENLGTEYFVVVFCRYNSSCRITVAAIHDSTTVQFEMKVRPNVSIFKTNGSEVVDPTFGVIMNNGDTISYESVGDLSGTMITGDKSFSVFFSAIVTDTIGIKHGSTRHILPSITLGTRYLLPHFQSADGGLLKIVAAFGDTQVEISSLGPIILSNRGNWILKAVPTSTGVTIDSNKPVLVASVELEVTLGVVCPKFNSMLILPPLEQWHGDAQFVVPALSYSNTEHIAVLTHKEDTNSIAIDSVYITASLFSDYPGTAYDEVEISIPLKRIHVRSLSLYMAGSIIQYEVYKNDTFFIENNYSTWQFFAYIGNEFRFPLNHGLKEINQVCVHSLMHYGDYKDNDCDGHIDEDICSPYLTPDPTADCSKPGNNDKERSNTCVKNVEAKWLGYTRQFPYTTAVEHFLAFMYHSSAATYGNVTITITSPFTTSVNVYSHYSPWTTSFTIQRGDIKELYSRAVNIVIPHQGTFVGNHGIRIVSTRNLKAVVTYLSMPNTVSSFLTYPTKMSGLDYFAVTELNGVSRCVVVATKDDTLLKVLLSSLSTIRVSYSGRIYRQGEIIALSMQSAETFQLESYDNLTGTRIRGNKPISVFCGGENQNGGNMAEQLFPSETWGKRYKLPPLNIVNLTTITIISRENLNSVTITSSGCSSDEQFALNYRGSYYTTVLNVTIPCVLDVHGQKEISVAIYFISNSADDKSLLVIPNIDQFVTNALFPIPEVSSAIETNIYFGYVSLDSTVTNAVELDGTVPLLTTYTEIGTGRHWVSSSFRILPFVYASSQSNESFSYAFMAGLKWPTFLQDCTPTTELHDGIDNDCDGIVDEEQCAIADVANLMFEEDCNQYLQWQTDTSTATDDTASNSISTDATVQYMPIVLTTQMMQTTEQQMSHDSTVSGQPGTSTETGVTDGYSISTDSTSYLTTTTVQDRPVVSTTQMVPTTEVSVSMTTKQQMSDDRTVPGLQSTQSFITHPNNCQCQCAVNILDTNDKLQQRLLELKTALKVEKCKLSSAVRKHSSASDNRTSVRYLGFSGVTVLILVVTIIILFDISTLVRDIKYRIKRSTSRYYVNSG